MSDSPQNAGEHFFSWMDPGGADKNRLKLFSYKMRPLYFQDFYINPETRI